MDTLPNDTASGGDANDTATGGGETNTNLNNDTASGGEGGDALQQTDLLAGKAPASEPVSAKDKVKAKAAEKSETVKPRASAKSKAKATLPEGKALVVWCFPGNPNYGINGKYLMGGEVAEAYQAAGKCREATEQEVAAFLAEQEAAAAAADEGEGE